MVDKTCAACGKTGPCASFNGHNVCAGSSDCIQKVLMNSIQGCSFCNIKIVLVNMNGTKYCSECWNKR